MLKKEGSITVTKGEANNYSIGDVISISGTGPIETVIVTRKHKVKGDVVVIDIGSYSTEKPHPLAEAVKKAVSKKEEVNE